MPLQTGNTIILIMLSAAAELSFLLYLSAKLRHDLHMLQQNSYRNERYRRWFYSHRKQERSIVAWLPFVLTLCAFVVPVFMPVSLQAGMCAGALLLTAVCLLLWLSRRHSNRAAKKPLIMTARAKRLYITALVIPALGICYAPFLLRHFEQDAITAALGIVILLLIAALSGHSGSYLLLVNTLLRPVETSVNNRYLHEAQQILANHTNLKRVAITGSYGKTSCKMILAAMLSEQYLTLATPESVNTPMGITRIIREQLKPIHEVFICEMGAKQPGDISELCNLVQPQLGLLSAIGPQHLETFGSQEAIAETKFELIRALPPDGWAVLNMDQEQIAARVQQANCQVIAYGLDAQQPYHGSDIRYSAEGLSFNLVAPDGTIQPMTSRLLGRHNVANIVGAAAAAHSLGLPLPLAARALRTLAPIPHRLQILPGNGYTIIDDAFNSNPEGAAAALEVLGLMEGGHKILVTPGMVELGAAQNELNRAFARAAARVCDFIILVGKKHSQPLQQGLLDTNYPPAQYAVVADLAEARQVLQRIVQPGDTVMFENDLPDTYNE